MDIENSEKLKERPTDVTFGEDVRVQWVKTPIIQIIKEIFFVALFIPVLAIYGVIGYSYAVIKDYMEKS